MSMAIIKVKDKNGKEIEINLPDSVDPKSLGELTKTIQSLKPKRASEKSEYGALVKVSGSEDKKFIIFKTDKDTFKYSFKDKSLIHSKTGEKFAPSHVSQMAMNRLMGRHYDGSNTWRICAEKTAEGSEWVKALFMALDRWSHGGSHYIDGMERRSRNNIRVFMENADVIQSLEPYVKTDYTMNQIIEQIADSFRHLMFDGGKIKPFNEVYKGGDKGIDDWITKHGSEPVARSWYMQDSRGYNRHRGASYDHMPEDQLHKLSKFTREYIFAKTHGYDDIFRIMWENHKIPITEPNVGQSLKNLVHDHNYDRVALASYVCESMPRQGIVLCSSSFDNSYLSWLVDYVNMNTHMGITEYEKYPRSIKLAHDVALVNYDIRRMKIEEVKYARAKGMADRYAYSPEGEKYMVIAPPTVSSIIQEGTVMHHCVATYVPRVLECETIIMFMRSVEKPEESVITIEVRDGAVAQAKAAHNKAPNQDQQKFLDGYKKHLKTVL